MVITISTTNCLNCQVGFDSKIHLQFHKKITHAHVNDDADNNSGQPELQLISFNGTTVQDSVDFAKRNRHIISIQDALIYLFEIQLGKFASMLQRCQIGLCEDCATLVIKLYALQKQFKKKSESEPNSFLHYIFSQECSKSANMSTLASSQWQEINSATIDKTRTVTAPESFVGVTHNASKSAHLRRLHPIAIKPFPNKTPTNILKSGTFSKKTQPVPDKPTSVDDDITIVYSSELTTDTTMMIPSTPTFKNEQISQKAAATADQFQPCKECGRSIHMYKMKKHLAIHDQKPLKLLICSICGRPLVKKSLKAHMTTHLGQNEIILSWKCTICGRVFKLQNAYQKHIDWHTMDSRSFKTKYPKLTVRTVECSLCEKKFTSKTATLQLNAHMITVHQSSSKHSCDICGKPFAYDRRLLDSHKRSHLSKVERSQLERENAYLCSECGAAFYNPAGLRHHHRRVHLKLTRKKHKCSKCSRQFEKRSDLEKHFKCHEMEAEASINVV